MLEKVPDETTTRVPPPAGAPRTGAPAVWEIWARLAERGVLLKKGGIVDATIISAPSSTRNESNARDPEMHQTRKGNQWHFGMKLHIGDCESIPRPRTGRTSEPMTEMSASRVADERQ